MDIEIITRPTLQSVETQYLKDLKRIRHSSEDALIDGFILAADEYASKRANISIMEQTIRYRTEYILPAIVLPRPPVLDILTLKYVPEDGAEVDVDVLTLERSRLHGLDLVTIPGVSEKQPGYIEATYTAGYPDSDLVPPSIKQAVTLLASHYYVNRENAYLDQKVLANDKRISLGFDSLIAVHAVPNVHEINAKDV